MIGDEAEELSEGVDNVHVGHILDAGKAVELLVATDRKSVV